VFEESSMDTSSEADWTEEDIPFMPDERDPKRSQNVENEWNDEGDDSD
jgi:hypothetical protein